MGAEAQTRPFELRRDDGDTARRDDLLRRGDPFPGAVLRLPRREQPRPPFRDTRHTRVVRQRRRLGIRPRRSKRRPGGAGPLRRGRPRRHHPHLAYLFPIPDSRDPVLFRRIRNTELGDFLVRRTGDMRLAGRRVEELTAPQGTDATRRQMGARQFALPADPVRQRMQDHPRGAGQLARESLALLPDQLSPLRSVGECGDLL